MRFPRSLTLLAPLFVFACGSSTTGGGGTPGGDGGVGADSELGPDGTPVDSGPPPTGAGCTVAKKGTAGVVLQGTLLLPDAPLLGELFVDTTGKIACVAKSCTATAGYDAATVLSCPDAVISPGLINAHDHTEYDTTGPIPHATTRWQHRNGWRTGAGGEPALPTKPAKTTDVKTIGAAELRFVMGGATSVIGSGGVSGLLRNLAAYKNPEQLEGAAGPTVFFDTFPLGDSGGEELTSGCAYPKIRAASTAFGGGGGYAPHVSEGINAAAENEFACISTSLALLTSQTAMIHSVGLNAKDVDAVAKANAKVIWSARTNIDLYGNTAPVTELKSAGVTIALGTDWHASGSMNMLRELHCVDALNQKYFAKAFSDRELWLMATKNAAVAAKFDGQIGELKVGLLADVAVFTGASRDYRAVLEAGVEDVRLVLRGGKPLYGDFDTVDAVQAGCARLDGVCGGTKAVCVDVPAVTLSDLQAVAASIYPLWFCKTETPKDEPSCVPYRDTYPNGTSATDRDGDGIDDGADDCPDVFNPTRPMDGTAQSDVDGDKAGDACDVAPLDPAKK
ncbi:MAG: hypothetical protein NVS3B10_05120 [Polyangiales bacterium]